MSNQYPPAPAPQPAAFSTTPPVFARVQVRHHVRGTTRVFWELGRHFAEPLPYTYSLQYGRTGLPAVAADGTTRVDDWAAVPGATDTNVFMLSDSAPRLWGKTADVHYRVALTTGTGATYYSQPANVYGTLGKRDWLSAREIVRQEQLRHAKQTSVRGYLVKAYRYGPLCECVDAVTKEVRNSRCPTCYGTGFAGGYFKPLPFSYADVSPEQTREMINAQTGTSKQQGVQARMLAEPQVYALDVWVAADSDLRYYIHPVKVEAQVRGVPVVISAELRVAPFTDIIYTLPVP